MVAKARTLNGTFSGYIAVQLLNAAVPRGVEVTLTSASTGGPTVLAPHQADRYGIGLTLTSGTRASVLLYDAKAVDSHDLLVRITSGSHAGKAGWVYASDASLSDGTSLLPLQP